MLRNHQNGEIRITEFNDYQMLIAPTLKLASGDVQSRNVSTLGLFQSPSAVNMGELSWRLGLALAAFNLMLMGLAVASVNPRVGKSYHLAVALFCFVGYYNMVNVGQNWIASGRTSLPAFMLMLHGGALIFALSWLMIRHFNMTWRSLLPNRRTAVKEGTA